MTKLLADLELLRSQLADIDDDNEKRSRGNSDVGQMYALWKGRAEIARFAGMELQGILREYDERNKSHDAT